MLSKIIKVSLIFLGYFIFGKVGLQFASVNASSTAIWAPTGIAIASFLLFGKRIWPIIFLGAFFTNLTTAGTVATSIGIAIGNTIEGLLGAYLINNFAGGRSVFDNARGIYKFCISIFFCCAVAATWGVSSLLLGGFAQSANVETIWITWWLGDVSGAIIVTPLIIFWSRKSDFKWNSNRQLEGIFLFLCLIITAGSIFNGLFINTRQILPLEFLCIPFLVWIALRFNQRASITALNILALLAILGTVRGYGSFFQYGQNESLLLVQAFLDVITLTIITLAAVTAERRQVRELFQSTLDNMREGFQIIGFDWKYLYVNKASAIQGKRSKEDLLGKTMMEMYPGIEKTEFFDYLRRCMFERRQHSMENEFSFPDGSKGWFGLKIEPVAEGSLILSVDITEQKDAQMTLAKEKAEAEALLNSIGDGIIATDQEGKIIMVNKAVEEMLGWKEVELLGIHSFEKILMEDEEKNIIFEKDRPLTKALKTGKKIIVMHYLVRKNGTKFPVRVTATPILLNGKIVGAIKVFHDITQEKEIDEMKTEFISMASHELRTPLSAIKGFISMINVGDYGKIDKKLERPLMLVASSTERLIKIVNEMLDVSRIDAGRVFLSVNDFRIQNVIYEVVDELQPIVTENKIKLNVEKGISLNVHADREKVVQILNNLIGNAIKFTGKGSLSINTRQKDNMVIILVKDTGAGIALSDKSKLFNKFEQLKSKKAGKIAGTGLGLYISREFARKMGGDLWIESTTLGKGSVFAFSLPVADAKRASI